MSDVFSICIMIYEVAIWYRLVLSKLDYRFNARHRYLPSLLVLISLLLRSYVLDAHLSQVSYVSPLISLVLLYLVTVIFYNNSLETKFIWNSIYLLLNIISEVVSILVFMLIFQVSSEELMGHNPYYMIAAVAAKLILLGCVLVLTKNTKDPDIILDKGMINIILIILLDFFICILVYDVMTTESTLAIHVNLLIMIILGVLLMMAGLTLSIIFQMNRRAKKALEHQLMLQQVEMNQQLNEDMSLAYEKLRSLRHDMSNHLGLIKGLCQHGAYEDLLQYIEHLYEDVETANAFVYVDNKPLNVLLNTKITRAKSKDIEIDYVLDIQALSIPEREICSLLGNLLDNAIEAASSRQGDGYIHLMIQSTLDNLSIRCENNYSKEPTYVDGRFISNKRDACNHGIGTATIAGIVEAYGGHISYDIEGSFVVTIQIPNRCIGGDGHV